MNAALEFRNARTLLLHAIAPVSCETVSLGQSNGRILAVDSFARENVPSFDRSPYDGYALRAEDTSCASPSSPVFLRVLEDIPAGSVPTKAILPGTASKILTGAPIPPGADAVIMRERTTAGKHGITLSAPLKSGDNIIPAGEDVRQGTLLSSCGQHIDPGLSGSLAAQGITSLSVYRRPRVALLSTGSELVEADQQPDFGQIRNSSRYMLENALHILGCEPVYLGIVKDSLEALHESISQGLEDCDAVLTTGGVSVGDYDLTPAAIDKTGAEFLFRGVNLKPGMACAYAVRAGKPIFALSGNPASAMTNFYALAAPALKKLAGYSAPVPTEFDVTILQNFHKKSPCTRLLRGSLVPHGSQLYLSFPQEQGNVVLFSAIGCNAMAIIPAGSGPVPAGSVLKGFAL